MEWTKRQSKMIVRSSSSLPLWVQKVIVLYMRDYNVLNDREEVALLAGTYFAVADEHSRDKSQITVHIYIY